MRVLHSSTAQRVHGSERVQRCRASQLAYLAVLATALLGCVLPQAASAKPGATAAVGSEFGASSLEPSASTEPEAISLTPSTTQPYFACPHGLCDAINEPPAIKTATGYALPNGMPLVGSGVNGGYTAEELELAYKIPKTGGSGQTVALIDAYGDTTAESDLAEYRKEYKLGECKKENANKEHCFKKVNQKGEEANYPANDEGWGEETSLDLDMVSAACPECHILLVEATNEEMSNLAASVNKAVELGATEISNSYGAPENYEPWCGTTGCAQYSSDYDHPEYENSKHEHYPVVITASAGDRGYDSHEFGSGVSLPEFPATSPYVIAVGGTSLYIEKNARTSETVWSKTGSGCSGFESTKTTGQKETEEKEGRKGCTSDRTDNDVAADASCATPVSFYSTPGFGGWYYECGTSASSPFVAGSEAHATEYTRDLSVDAFYKKPSMLFHVSEGSNGECGTESESKWYLCHATKEGYNGPTGMGTPDGVFAVTGAPLTTTRSATGATETGATLNGTANPGGLETKYYFEYGTTASYGSKTAEASAGSGTSNLEESKAITGLTGKTTYHFRIVATNSNGTTDGFDQVFQTAGKPSVETKAATSVRETEATLNGIVNPDGAETKYDFEYGTTISYGSKTTEVGVGSSTSNLEVSKTITGLVPGTTYHFRIVAMNSYGTTDGSDHMFTMQPPTWSLQTTPNPAGATRSELLGVSCTSSNACAAVGLYKTSGSLQPHAFAEGWGGTEWSLQTVPGPTEMEEDELKGASCTSSSACTAVGEYWKKTGGGLPLAERWSGTEWSVQPTRTPTGGSNDSLKGVSCASAKACTAVGYYENSKGTWLTLAEGWNGTEWSVQSTPSPAEGNSYLKSVSCTSATACIAVGNNPGHYPEDPIAERWNGTEWSAQSIPTVTSGGHGQLGAEQVELKSVSCTSTTACTAVGHYWEWTKENEGFYYSLVEVWNGTEWSIHTSANMTGDSTDLEGVSCTSATACMAVGQYGKGSNPYYTFTESWNGTEWSIKSSPNKSGAIENILQTVSCVSPVECVATGLAGASFSEHLDLAEKYG